MATRTSGTITVYAYKLWDEAVGEHRQAAGKCTVDALARMPGCTPLEGTGEDVPVMSVTEDGFYFPPSATAQDVCSFGTDKSEG